MNCFVSEFGNMDGSLIIYGVHTSGTSSRYVLCASADAFVLLHQCAYSNAAQLLREKVQGV